MAEARSKELGGRWRDGDGDGDGEGEGEKLARLYFFGFSRRVALRASVVRD